MQIIVIIAGVIAVLFLLIPFMLLSIMGLLRQIRDELKRSGRRRKKRRERRNRMSWRRMPASSKGPLDPEVHHRACRGW